MYLEELILDNFKSFGAQTRIPLREDFTAITGPNGSGKSNILDAIQFALGLGRVSDVRARRLTDLIHHTDDSEPRLPRETEVTVILNNEDGTLTAEDIATATGQDVADPSRIKIRRRIRQTANNSYSYYYIDGHSVNLRDIRELMARAGVSDERYNIVPQGDITELINRTPMQRRLIIDEIAGVAEFDAKKEQSQRELDTVRDRIEEVRLRVEEKSSTLEQLERERDEALAYQELADEKAQFEQYRDIAELSDRKAERDEVTDEIEQLEADLEAARIELAESEEVATRIEEDIEDLTEEIERKGGEEQRELQREIEELRSSIGQLQGRIEEKGERIDSLHADRRDAELNLDRTQERLNDLEKQRREIEVRKANRTGDLVELQDDLAAVQASIDNLDAEQRTLNDRLAKQETLRSEALDTKDALQRRLDRLSDEARRRDRELEELTNSLDELEDIRDERVDERDAVDLEMKRTRKEREAIGDDIEQLEGEADELQSTIDELEADISTAKQRLGDLQRQQQSSGKGQFPSAVARVLGSDISGVHGAIASLGDVENEAHAEACEAAGGGRLANVVVDDSQVGKDCIEYLKRRNAGRATFLPLTEFDEHGLPQLPDHPGVVDFARRLVTYDDRYAGVFSYVLGSTLVVQDMDTARELMGEFRMVTLDGDVVERSGAMRGGSGRETPYRFGGKRGRLERLARRIEALENDRDEAVETRSGVTDKLAELRERDRTLRDTIRDLERDRVDLTDGIDRIEGRIKSTNQQINSLREDREKTADQIEAIQTELAAATAATEAIQAIVDDLKTALSNTRLGELTEQRSKLRDEIDQVKDDIDELDGRLNDIALEERSANDRSEEHKTTIANTQNEIADLEDDIESLTEQIDALEDEIDARQSEIDALESDLAELRADREEKREDLAQARETVNANRKQMTGLEHELGPLRDRLERLEWEIAELSESVDPVEDEDELPELDEVTDRITELESEMAAMEPINQKAIEQYDRLEGEIKSLEADINELEEERAAIIERIESYEEQKREAFMEAFTAIDEEYRDIFRTLSGGSAALELENEDDPFDGGLILRAQPEDKFVGSLEQLSGGEKSLTALSLIFAIQRYRPAPFYALDEIDAFLDAANLDRIGDLLESHRDDGQFIVISHHADLLERADNVIGVSMPEDLGSSKVSGVTLAGGAPADD